MQGHAPRPWTESAELEELHPKVKVETEDMRIQHSYLEIIPPRASRSGLADTISNGTISLCRSAIDPGHGRRRHLKIFEMSSPLVLRMMTDYPFLPG